MTLGLISRFPCVCDTYGLYRCVSGHWYSFPGVVQYLAHLKRCGSVAGSPVAGAGSVCVSAL